MSTGAVDAEDVDVLERHAVTTRTTTARRASDRAWCMGPASIPHAPECRL
jgi:hypothetical protein